MSRVYEALRQSELERGATGPLLDPDTFLSPPLPATAPSPGSRAVAWDEIAPFQPMLSAEDRLVALTEDNSLGAEKFRLLSARLRHIGEQKQIRKVLITSAVPDEGKTLVSINLAISLSKHTTQRILLLEGDLRRPALAIRWGMPDFPGLDKWFSGNEPIGKFMCRVNGLQLALLVGGVPRDNPLAILQSPRFVELYQQLSNCFDWVLIDAPPLLPVSDVNFWSRHSDGLLLVLREGKAPKKILQKGLETLDNPRLIGVVLNDTHAIERSYYHHYYGAKKQSHQ